MVVPQTKTVDLDADLVERAQREADKRGIALKQLVDDALERELTGEGQRSSASARLGLGRSTDELSAAKTADEPVRPPDPSRRATPRDVIDADKATNSGVERRRGAAERLRGLFADVAPDRSMADELIGERRAEARTEDREDEARRRRRTGH